MNRRKAAILLIALSLGCGSGGEEATSPDAATTEPVAPAARTSPTIILEVDRMAGVPDLPETVTMAGRSISLQSIFAAAGLDVRVVRDQVDLPDAPAVRLADLHALMTRFRSVTVPAGAARLHLLIVSRSAERPGDLGIMFDFGNQDADDLPREAFAIYADPHAELSGDLQAEMLLTAAHELAHCFNLHHPDWEGTDFRSDATIESYSMADTVRWSLSERSRQHLATHPSREVRFGSGNLPFAIYADPHAELSGDLQAEMLLTAAHLARHQQDPAESFDVFEPDAIDTVARGASRSPGLSTVSARTGARMVDREQHPLRLELAAAKTEWTVGEPVSVTVGLHNRGTQSLAVRPLLDPAYHFLNLEIRPPGSDAFLPFRPLLLREARGAAPLELAPGAAIYEEVKVFFGADGWWFTKPGRYDLRVDFPAGDGENRVESPVLTLTVRPAQTEASSRAARLVLGKQQGLYLFFEGGDHLTAGAAQLRKLVQEIPDAVQAPAARLALGIAALEPTVGVDIGGRPDLGVAQGYLRNILQTDLPPEALVRAQGKLAEELEQVGREAAGRLVRRETVKELRDEESVAAQLEAVRAGRVPTAATDERDDSPPLR
jgi:hypothetical protein